MFLTERTVSLYIRNPSFAITLVCDWNLPLGNLWDAKFCCHIPQPIHTCSCARRSWTQQNKYYIYCRPIPVLQNGIGFIRLRVWHKKCCVYTHLGFTSGDRTFRAQWAVPAECDTVAAWNVVYQDFISHSTYKNASMVFAGGRLLLQDELGKLTGSPRFVNYTKYLVARSLLIILCIRDTCGLTEWDIRYFQHEASCNLSSMGSYVAYYMHMKNLNPLNLLL